MTYLGFLAFQSGLDLNFGSMTYGLLRSHAKDRNEPRQACFLSTHGVSAPEHFPSMRGRSQRRSRLMGKITLAQYPKIKERITAEMLDAEAELERLEGQINESQEMEQWSNWVKTFRKQIESYRKFNPHQRKDVLQKLLTYVDVHLLNNQTHWLEIQFKVPLVGDLLLYKDPKQKALGYSLKDGVTALMVEQVSRPYRKKKPIETRA